MPILFKRLLAVQPCVKLENTCWLQDFVFDSLGYFFQRAVLVNAYNVHLTMKMRITHGLMLRSCAQSNATTKDPAHGHHIAAEFVLAKGVMTVSAIAARTLEAHAYTQETC